MGCGPAWRPGGGCSAPRERPGRAPRVERRERARVENEGGGLHGRLCADCCPFPRFFPLRGDPPVREHDSFGPAAVRKGRRKFDDEDDSNFLKRGRLEPQLTEDPDLPEVGDRWSTWD